MARSLAAKRIYLLLWVLGLVVLGFGPDAHAQMSPRTIDYQGELNNGELPAEGAYDFEFKLLDANGSQVGNALVKEDIQVLNGQFWVELDFGAALTDTVTYTLSVAVRQGTSTAAFTPLTHPASALVMAASNAVDGSASTTNVNAAVVQPQASAAIVYGAATTAPANAVYVAANGNTGIGSTNPLGKLHVTGHLVFDRAGSPVIFLGSSTTELNRYLQVINSPQYSAAAGLKVGGLLVADSYAYANPIKNNLIVKGSVGIGTAAPTHRLHVVAVGAQDAAVFAAESGREYAGIRLRPVGTATDYTANEVSLSTLPNGGFGIQTYDPPGQNGKFRFTMARNGQVSIGEALWMLPDPRYGDGGAALSYDVNDSLVINPVKTFLGGVYFHSKVVIGRPQERDSLDVIGNVKIDGTTSSKVLQITGGDLAEPFAVADAKTIRPGMVVAIDPDNPGQMRLALKAYDRTVAGVVSGAGGINAGVIMYKDGENENTHPIALAGRVYVYADASNGAIQPGDLLTTAATPGHAMKVTDYTQAQGAILGKAMSKLAEGTGLVLVLVTLQ